MLEIMKTFNKILPGYHCFLEFKLPEKSTEHICRDSDKFVRSSKKKIADNFIKMNQCSHRTRESLDSLTGRKSANSIGMVFVKVKTMCNVLPNLKL